VDDPGDPAPAGRGALGPRRDMSPLGLLLPAGRGESLLPCEVVRRIPRDEESGRPAGLAVRFRDLAPEQVAQLDAFVAAGSFASGG